MNTNRSQFIGIAIAVALLSAGGAGATTFHSRTHVVHRPHAFLSPCTQSPIIFQSSFQTQPRSGFSSPGFGSHHLSVWIGENPHHFGIDALIRIHRHGQESRSVLFALPRQIHSAHRILDANRWQFIHHQDGYRITVEIDQVWLDQFAIPRCSGRITVQQIAPVHHVTVVHCPTVVYRPMPRVAPARPRHHPHPTVRHPSFHSHRPPPSHRDRRRW